MYIELRIRIYFHYPPFANQCNGKGKTFAIAFAAKCSHNFWQQPSQNNKLASAARH